MNNRTKMVIVKNYLDVLKMNKTICKFELVQFDLDLEVSFKFNEDLTLKQAKKVCEVFYEFLSDCGVDYTIWNEDCGIDSIVLCLRGICDY